MHVKQFVSLTVNPHGPLPFTKKISQLTKQDDGETLGDVPKSSTLQLAFQELSLLIPGDKLKYHKHKNSRRCRVQSEINSCRRVTWFNAVLQASA